MAIARRIVQLEGELAQTRSLEVAKEIARLENEYARLAHDDRPVVAEAIVEQGDADDAGDVPSDTYAERIRSVLIKSSVPLTAPAIAAAIGPPNSLPTVRAILSKLVGGGIERISTGLYAARVGHRSGAADDD
jgi:hypothetical protein